MSMAATAELLEQDYRLFEPEPPERTRVVNIAEMPEDRMVKARAERFIKGVGATALNSVEVETVVEADKPEPQIRSLQEAIHDAAWGDETARQLVKRNVTTDLTERVYKSGNITKTKLEVDEVEGIVQFGQSMESVYENSLLYASETPKMRGRSEAETRNGFRLEQLRRQGKLKDNYFVVVSRCADDMTDEELSENNFFVDSKSTVIQATTEIDNQDEGSRVELEMSSAFVAGVAAPGRERHDKQAVEGMADELGVDYKGKTAVRIIDEPLLIPKAMMPNGVSDLVSLLDKHAGGTFFGEDKEVQDYQEYEKFCEEREQKLAPTVDKIVDQLIAEVDTIKTPVEAVQRVSKLAGESMVKHAISVDNTIDPRVFGATSAGHIIDARQFAQNGNLALAALAENKAKATEKSTSCPSALKQGEKFDAPDLSKVKDDVASGADAELGSKKESMTGEIRCIKCRKYVKKAEVVKPDCWECPSCNHKVDICTGKVLVQGKS